MVYFGHNFYLLTQTTHQNLLVGRNSPTCRTHFRRWRHTLHLMEYKLLVERGGGFMPGLTSSRMDISSSKPIIRTMLVLPVDIMRIVHNRSQITRTLRLIDEIKKGGELAHPPPSWVVELF